MVSVDMPQSGLKEKFYLPEELRGAVIFDSEGLLYGEVSGVDVEEDGVKIIVSSRLDMGGRFVDAESLRARLVAAGVPPKGGETLEELVGLARKSGVQVPYRSGGRLEIVKARMPVEDVLWIDEKVLDVAPYKGRYVVILLRTPREARYRGVRGSSKPKTPMVNIISNKLVLSQSRGLLGVAADVSVGFGEPGIRIYTRRAGETEILWLAYLSSLRREGLMKLADELYGLADPYNYPRLPGRYLARITETLKRLKAPEKAFTLLRNYVQVLEEREIYEDVPWSSVLKVGDAIICR